MCRRAPCAPVDRPFGTTPGAIGICPWRGASHAGIRGYGPWGHLEAWLISARPRISSPLREVATSWVASELEGFAPHRDAGDEGFYTAWRRARRRIARWRRCAERLVTCDVFMKVQRCSAVRVALALSRVSGTTPGEWHHTPGVLLWRASRRATPATAPPSDISARRSTSAEVDTYDLRRGRPPTELLLLEGKSQEYIEFLRCNLCYSIVGL